MYEIDTATAYTLQVITIEYWEWAVLLNVFLFMLIFTYRVKLLNIERNPEYKFYVWGFYAKFASALGFALVSYYIYQGGDTYSYFQNAMSMANLFYKDPGSYFYVLFSGSTNEALNRFDFFTGYPYDYIYFDPKTFLVVKLISPIAIITFKSYLLTSVIVGYITYRGTWKLFQMFTYYYPQLMTQMAVAILFIPSVLFWGSGILKDPFTLMATGLFIFYFHEVFLLRLVKTKKVTALLLSSLIIIGIKPYIFMILLPCVLFWFLYSRSIRIQNSRVLLILIPVVMFSSVIVSLLFFTSISDSMDKFSVDKALSTASVTQYDLKQDYYEGKSFDIGNFDGTPISAIKLMPMAIIAGLFRPFLFEANSPFMLLSALENLFLLFLFLRLFFQATPYRVFKEIFKDPMVLFSFLFGVFFAFMLGLTTSNYGALIRFKIPMLPVFAAGLFILSYKLKQLRKIQEP